MLVVLVGQNKKDQGFSSSPFPHDHKVAAVTQILFKESSKKREGKPVFSFGQKVKIFTEIFQ